MKTVLFFLLLFTALLPAEPPVIPVVVCHFTPGCEAAVVAQLALAHKTLRCQAYGFTSLPIADAMIDAKKRGVDVQVIMDARAAEPGNHDVLTLLLAAQIPVYLDAVHAIAHNKVIESDQHWVITGSFNFTFSAEHRNAENVVIITDAAAALSFEANWNQHLAHSKKAP